MEPFKLGLPFCHNWGAVGIPPLVRNSTVYSTYVQYVHYVRTCIFGMFVSFIGCNSMLTTDDWFFSFFFFFFILNKTTTNNICFNNNRAFGIPLQPSGGCCSSSSSSSSSIIILHNECFYYYYKTTTTTTTTTATITKCAVHWAEPTKCHQGYRPLYSNNPSNVVSKPQFGIPHSQWQALAVFG